MRTFISVISTPLFILLFVSGVQAVVPPDHKIILYENGLPLENKPVVIVSTIETEMCKNNVCLLRVNWGDAVRFYVFPENTTDVLELGRQSFENQNDWGDYVGSEVKKAEYSVDLNTDSGIPLIFKYDLANGKLLEIDDNLWSGDYTNPLEVDYTNLRSYRENNNYLQYFVVGGVTLVGILILYRRRKIR